MTDPMRTADGETVQTIVDHFEELLEIGDGPALEETVLREYGTMKLDEALSTPGYGDHLERLREWVVRLEKSVSVPIMRMDTSVLRWFENTQFSSDPEDRADDDEAAYVGFRLVDESDGEPLFQVTIDYYVTGDVFASLRLANGYSVQSSPSGDEGGKFVHTYIADGRVRDMGMNEIRSAVESCGPYVLSRVHELVTNQNAKLSQARAHALSEVGYSNQKISDLMGVSKSAVSSYKSKFNTETRTAERRLVCNVGVPKSILAEHDFRHTNYVSERAYVAQTFPTKPEKETTYVLVTVTVGGRDSSGLEINFSTNAYPTLDALISGEYDDRVFTDEYRAEETHELMQAISRKKREKVGFGTLSDPFERLDNRIP